MSAGEREQDNQHGDHERTPGTPHGVMALHLSAHLAAMRGPDGAASYQDGGTQRDWVPSVYGRTAVLGFHVAGFLCVMWCSDDGFPRLVC